MKRVVFNKKKRSVSDVGIEEPVHFFTWIEEPFFQGRNEESALLFSSGEKII
jgi:hypothetical protein